MWGNTAYFQKGIIKLDISAEIFNSDIFGYNQDGNLPSNNLLHLQQVPTKYIEREIQGLRLFSQIFAILTQSS